MSMIICPECRKEISEQAQACPKCGCNPQDEKLYRSEKNCPTCQSQKVVKLYKKSTKYFKIALISLVAAFLCLIVPVIGSIVGSVFFAIVPFAIIFGVISLLSNKAAYQCNGCHRKFT